MAHPARFKKTPRRHIREINIVPILDMLTTVIFFLLLSTSFIEFNKVTVPPSQTQIITTAEKQIPLQPILTLTENSQKGFKLLLSWSGEKPGHATKTFPAPTPEESEAFKIELAKTSKEFSAELKGKFPNEQALQLGLGSAVPYEYMIALMDGTREAFPDAILISFLQAQALADRGGSAE